MRIAGIVIYLPDYIILEKNIQILYDQVDKIVLYLNSAFDLKIIEGLDKIRIINNGNNNGIATALNSIMTYAKAEGAKWCLLLDQDSIVTENYMLNLEKHLFLDGAAIVTPAIVDEYEKDSQKKISDNEVEKISMCITSGSYNKIEVWEKVGGFRDELFIDYVDWEYSARVRNSEYFIYRVNSVQLKHRLGERTYHSILGYTLFTYNHNAFRKYYITRNTIVSYRLFPNEKEFLHPYVRIVKRIIVTLLFEKNKKEKIIAIINGVKDSNNCYKRIKGS